jgi:chemotaxis signal transduction protein
MRVAIGEFEMLHIILGRQRFFIIPHAPDYCRSVFLWQGRVIPAFDLSVYLHSTKTDAESISYSERYICIVNYRDSTATVHHGALLLYDLPIRISVNDDKMCELPGNNKELRSISSSCFQDADHGPIPVLNLPGIFCAR